MGILLIPEDVSLPATPRRGKNHLLNGAFNIWQRGTTLTPTGKTRTADRWDVARGGYYGAFTASQVASGLTGFPWALRFQRNAGDTGTNGLIIGQTLERLQGGNLLGQLMTFSVWIRCGSTYSGQSQAAVLVIAASPNVVNDLNAMDNASSYTTLLNFTPTTTWQQFIGSVVVPGAGGTNGNVAAMFNSGALAAGTAGANDYIDFTGAQLEIGPIATPFDFISFDEDLADCERFFQKSFDYAVTPAQNTANLNGLYVYSVANAGAVSRFNTVPLQNMRAAPTVTFYNPNAANANWRNLTLNADSAAAAAHTQGQSAFSISNAQVAGDAVGNNIGVHWTADAEF